jgi:hypothetical protein
MGLEGPRVEVSSAHVKALFYVGSRCFEIRAAAEAPARPRGDAPLRLLFALAADDRARAGLRRLLAEMSPSASVARMSDEALLREWTGLVARGRFSVAELPRADVIAGPAGEERDAAQEPPPPERRTPRTWIEIQMVGEDDLPLAGERYAIELPDGSRREGRLDSKGLARVDGIDPGSCVITFPALDEEAWTRA